MQVGLQIKLTTVNVNSIYRHLRSTHVKSLSRIDLLNLERSTYGTATICSLGDHNYHMQSSPQPVPPTSTSSTTSDWIEWS